MGGLGLVAVKSYNRTQNFFKLIHNRLIRPAFDSCTSTTWEKPIKWSPSIVVFPCKPYMPQASRSSCYKD